MNHAQRRFETLVCAYSADLYRFAYWLCRERAQAEDLVQETLLRAWRALDDLRDENAAKGWLFTILRREFLRRPVRSLAAEREPPEPAGPVSDGLEAWQLRRALHALPLKYREPLLLQVLGGYRCEEIAALLALSPAAVTTRLFRARQKLRSALTHDASADAAREYDHELS